VEQEVKENEILITDIWLATLLKCKGFEILRHIKTKKRFVFFYFKKDPEIDEVIKDWINGEIVVNAKEFVQEYKILKTLTF